MTNLWLIWVCKCTFRALSVALALHCKNRVSLENLFCPSMLTCFFFWSSQVRSSFCHSFKTTGVEPSCFTKSWLRGLNKDNNNIERPWIYTGIECGYWLLHNKNKLVNKLNKIKPVWIVIKWVKNRSTFPDGADCVSFALSGSRAGLIVGLLTLVLFILIVVLCCCCCCCCGQAPTDGKERCGSVCYCNRTTNSVKTSHILPTPTMYTHFFYINMFGNTLF